MTTTVNAFELYSSLDTETLLRMKDSMEGNIDMMEEILDARMVDGEMFPTDHPHIKLFGGQYWAYGIDCTGEYGVISVEDDFFDALYIVETLS